MAKRIDDFEIIENKRLTDELFILELSGNEITKDFKPGQFVQVRVDGNAGTFLRRPVSVHDIDYSGNSFKLMIQIAGPGTKALSCLGKGDTLNLIYPLGNSFSSPLPGSKVLLAGGGVGIAPLLLMGRQLVSQGIKYDWLLGFRNIDRIPDLSEYRKTGDVYLTTEDGSSGVKGYITDHSLLKEEQYDKVYCCGPDPMMRAVAAYCRKNDIICEVSLENLMACGFGICLCCIAETVKGNLCTCTEGPVFNINDLKW
jgi:dihydroorotate dehydrogenase electron transfer subunit